MSRKNLASIKVNCFDELNLNNTIVFLTIFFAFTSQSLAESTLSLSLRTDWTTKTVFQKDGNIYFTGGFLNGSDYSMSIRCANAEALKVATQSISQYIRGTFSTYTLGKNPEPAGLKGMLRTALRLL
jgi:hypothetical protein